MIEPIINYILVKDGAEVKTTSTMLASILSDYGWRLKISELGELL